MAKKYVEKNFRDLYNRQKGHIMPINRMERIMFFHHDAKKKEGRFVFSGNVTARASKIFDKDVIKEFWRGHTFRLSKLELDFSEELAFSVGNAHCPSLDGNDYAINVEENGFCVTADTEKNLMYGFITLLDLIKADEDGERIYIECQEIKESPVIKNRMVHYCIFPDTELWELEKFVRFCGALKYSHIILEFWGMLRYDFMRELSWGHAFSKADAARIIGEANTLGIEVIPMFNHWGHAAACRICHGKHVVLDQAPELQSYFSEDGWCWNYKSEKVRKLLKNIRTELIELCGNGEYFHVGCDEAYGFDYSKESMDAMCGFLNGIAADLEVSGRKMIMWGDMCLCKNPEYTAGNRYSANCISKEKEDYMLAHIDKKIVMADWQYNAYNYPIETALVFKNAGFETLVCPWDQGPASTDTCLDTVKNHKLSGIMHTTWHTLSLGTPYVARTAASCWDKSFSNTHDFEPFRSGSASIMRKVYFVNGDYRSAGWAKQEIEVIC